MLALLLCLAHPIAAQAEAGALDETETRSIDDDLFADEALEGDADLFSEDTPAKESEVAIENESAEEASASLASEAAGSSDEGATSEEIIAESTPSPAVQPSAEVEEILIVGEAAAEQWQDAPASAVAFDAETLKAERIQNIQDIADFTPNLEISAPGTNPVLFIRGVGLDDFNANSTSAVAVYQDGIYMNSPAGQLFGFFDTESVQVLRGPHGGPYRNASAGAILVQSTPPRFEHGGYASLTHGNYDLVEGEGAVTGPLSEDWLAYRFSFRFTERGGFTKNRCDGQPLQVGGSQTRRGTCKALRFPGTSLGSPQNVPRRVNDESSWALRAQLLTGDVTLGDTNMEWLWNGHFGRSDAGAYQFQQRGFRFPQRDAEEKIAGPDATGYRDTDGDPFAGDYNVDAPEKLDVAGTFLRGRWELSGDHEVLMINGYEWHDRDSTQHTDANPNNLAVSRFTDEAWQFTSDLRIESHWSDTLSTIFGGYFIIEDLDAFNMFDLPIQGSIVAGGTVLDQTMKQDTRGYAFFGDVTWEFWTDLTLHADLRYNEEYKKLDVLSTGGQPSAPVATDILGGDASDTWRGVSGSASLEYAFDEWASVYVKYSRGWKPGHFNGGATLSRAVITPVDPESVNAYEVGVRTDWFDDRLSLDAAFFYYAYEDQQIFQLNVDQTGGVPLPRLINAEEAVNLGVEVDLEASPIDGLEIRLSMAYLDTEYDKFEATFSELIPRPPGAPPGEFQFRDVILDYTGNQLVGAPRWSGVGAIQYTLPLPRLRSELIPRLSATYKDKVFFDPAEGTGNRFDLPGDTVSQDAYWLLNATVTWRILSGAPGSMEVSGWVRNLADKEYRSQSFDVTEQGLGFVLDAYGAPRTYGITVRAAF